MVEIRIDADICKRCGSCAMACPVAILQQEEKGAIPQINGDGLERCFRCGQCVSICRQGAISHSHFPEGTVSPIRPETHNIYGALAMGYPRLKFDRWPQRNPAKVTWVGEKVSA